MLDALSALGIDLEALEWKDLALCDGMPTNMFYDEYESDENVAKVVDEMCLSCPVMKQCLLSGMENDEWGVWGGIYLMGGNKDRNRNSHKTEDIWEAIRERVS
jgi:hypothetical protein